MKRILYSLLVVMQVITTTYSQIDLLKDINPGILVPEIHNGTVYHGSIYYGSGELWRTDGTTEGTSLVKEIQPGNGGGEPFKFFIFNDLLYFSATDSHGRELWKTDGTSEGTVMVIDINPGIADSNPEDYVVHNGKIFFHATTATSGTELWVTDGTAAGTRLVYDANPGTGSSTSTYSQGSVIFSFHGAIYFAADDGTPGAELWKTDGTPSGTTLVKDLHEAIPNSFINFLLEVNSKLFMSAQDGQSTRLWTSDGSTAGTTPLGNMTIEAPGDINPTRNQVRGNYLFFAGADGPSTNGELWKTDGTLANTKFIADINGDPAVGSIPLNLTFVGQTLYFAARSTSDYEAALSLYKSNGEPGNFTLVSNQFEPGYGPMNLRDFNGILTYASRTKFGWYDGSVVKTQEAGLSGNQETNAFVELNDVLYFSPTGINKFDGNTVSKVGVNTLHSSNPSSFTEAGGGVTYFAADDGVNGMELWRSNGPGDASMVKNINQSGNSNPSQFKMFNGKLYFAANDGPNGFELWQSDGTEAGTFLVSDISAGTANSSPTELTIYENALYFIVNRLALWKKSVDGAPELIIEAPGTSSLTVSMGSLFFMGYDLAAGKCSLFKSDGTSAGTVVVNNNIPGCFGPTGPTASLIPMNSKIYFEAQSASFQSELWVYDGVTSTAVRPYSDGGPGDPGNFNVVGNTLYFGGSDAVHGYELWKTDGTAANTVIVKDIKPGTNSSLFVAAAHGPPSPPRFDHIGFDNKLFFTADDGVHGYELWVSDGTEAGTVLLNDLAPGAAGATPSKFAVLDSSLYFLTTQYPYATNGLSCGTRQIQSSGYKISNPLNLAVVGSKLFVSLKDLKLGQEPFVINPSQVPPPPDGCGTPPPPNFTQPTVLVFSDIKNNAMTVSFTPSSQPGAGYITLMRASNSPYPNDAPVDGTIYQVGSTIGASVVVGVGPDTVLKLKNLDATTTYYFDVFAYDSTHDYLNVNPLAGSQRTGKTDAPEIVGISFPNVTENTITVSLTPSGPAADGYITLMKTSSFSTDVPQDGSTYQTGSVIGNSVVVGFNNSTSVNVTSLNPGTEYFFTVFPFTQSSSNYDYLTAGSIAGRQQTIGVVTAVITKEDRIAYPNPFTDVLTIPFYTANDNTPVHVIIYDQVGRTIAEVINTTFATGNHEVRWDRTDSQGNKVQAGLYVYHIKTTGAGSVMQGLVVAR